MDNPAQDATEYLRNALRSCDITLGALIRAGAYEEAKVVFWEMHAISRRLQLEQGSPSLQAHNQVQ